MNSVVEIVDVSGRNHIVDISQVLKWTSGKDVYSIHKNFNQGGFENQADGKVNYTLILEDKSGATMNLTVSSEQYTLFLEKVLLWERRN